MGISTALASIDLVVFSSTTDVVPRPRRVSWANLAVRLGRHTVRREKDGPGWSPARYARGATRGNAGVVAVSALVLDADHAEPAWPRLDGLAFAAHTTHSHHPAEPRWRLVIPFARPVPAREWDPVWRRAVHHLLPGADPACKDPARLHYWPACRPGAPRLTRTGFGAPLDVAALPPAPATVLFTGGRPLRPAGASAGGRPGDDFEACTDWRAVLEPHGWRLVYERGGEGYWRRPGKARGVSATTGYAGGNALYVFSSSAPPFTPGASYSKFAAHTLLEHRGDFAAAAVALAGRGYGRPAAGDLVCGADGGPVRRLPRAAPRRGAALPAVVPAPGISLSGRLGSTLPSAPEGAR